MDSLDLSNLDQSLVYKQIKLVEESLTEYANLRQSVVISSPTKEQTPALALLLHSVYNGIENILVPILKSVNNDPKKVFFKGGNKNPEAWHSNVLDLAFNDFNGRKRLLNDTHDLKDIIENYKGLRHVVRHRYIHELDGDTLREESEKLDSAWENFKNQILSLIEEHTPREGTISTDPLKED